MDPSRCTEKYLEEYINNKMRKSKQMRETQNIWDNIQDDLYQVEGGYREEKKREDGNRKRKNNIY